MGATKVFLESDIARIDCRSCRRVRTQVFPWARPGARHTRDFEDVVAWLAQRADMATVAALMRCSWAASARHRRPGGSRAHRHRPPERSLPHRGRRGLLSAPPPLPHHRRRPRRRQGGLGRQGKERCCLRRLLRCSRPGALHPDRGHQHGSRHDLPRRRQAPHPSGDDLLRPLPRHPDRRALDAVYKGTARATSPPGSGEARGWRCVRPRRTSPRSRAPS